MSGFQVQMATSSNLLWKNVKAVNVNHHLFNQFHQTTESASRCLTEESSQGYNAKLLHGKHIIS